MQKRLPSILLCTLTVCCISPRAYADNADGASDLGVDYAFMFLMALSPDFAAANYTIENENGPDVDVSIYRLPYQFDLLDNAQHKLKLEVSVAYQRTTEVLPTFPIPGESIDAVWTTYGGSVGLLYERALTKRLRFTPSLQLGVAKMRNEATYNGPLTNASKDTWEGTILNWNTNASVINAGLGLSYDWILASRTSHVNANLYRVVVDSYNESNPAVKFRESANMFTLDADMIFPTEMYIAHKRMDYVLLLGMNSFLGENRHTLGYTTSYYAGVGTELPNIWSSEKAGHLRVSGQVHWATNMHGWLVTIGYNPE